MSTHPWTPCRQGQSEQVLHRFCMYPTELANTPDASADAVHPSKLTITARATILCWTWPPTETQGATATNPRPSGHSYIIFSLLPPTSTVVQAGLAMHSMPTLRRSHPAMWDLSSLSSDPDAQLRVGHVPSLDFRLRDQGRISCFGTAPTGRGGYGLVESICSAAGKAFGKVAGALQPKQYDVLYSRRKGFVEVPRGRTVSEREWGDSESRRKVQFSPRIRVSVCRWWPKILRWWRFLSNNSPREGVSDLNCKV